MQFLPNECLQKEKNDEKSMVERVRRLSSLLAKLL